jgi:quinohemoprotein ethanol dehydrogenase
MKSRAMVLLAGLTLQCIAAGQQAKQVDDAVLRDAGTRGEEWLTYGLTPGETRYSPLNQINASNVSRLGLAWSYEPGPGGGGQEATPLVWNGALYAVTNWSVVFALDARTGKERWRWDPEINQTAVRPKICCGVVNRGLALYEGKVIVPVNDGRLQALDAETGKPVWEARVAYPQDNFTLTMAPRIAKGKVIVGVSGAEFPVRGFFAAYDAKTGQFAWRFYTVPGDPSKPFENEAMKKAAKTWSGDWWKLGGGGSVWDGMAYDPEADLLYVGTGNGGPWPETLRKSTGKDNLYVASVLAVKPDNGELKWYFQMVPGDSWDFDSVQQLMLADLSIKGKQRKVIMQANKNGFYYVLDRVTGAFISGQPFAQVNWAKGLDESTGRPIVNPEARYGSQPVKVFPSAIGAHNWSPMSFNPIAGLAYIPSSPNTSMNYAVDPAFTHQPGKQNLGLDRAGFAAGDKATNPPAIGPTPISGQQGVLIAWDPVTQQERWRAAAGGSTFGGTVTTAGNLVFQVAPDGRLFAYSADKGEKLLEIQTGLKSGMGPPITYQLDGKQYVTLMGGTGKVIYMPGEPGPPPPAGASNAPPRMLTFVLDGKEPLPAASESATPKP